MQLLSPTDIRKDKNDQQVRDILRTQELRKAEDQARLKLAKAQMEFSDTLAKNRQQWAEEEQEHIKDVQRRKREIEQLEQEKLNLLVPFDVLKDGVYSDMEDAQSFLTKLRQREQAAEELTELLQDRLDEVGEREQDIISREQQATAREDEIRRQEQAWAANTETLNTQIREFLVQKAATEKDLANQKDNLNRFSQSLTVKEVELLEKEQALVAQAKRLSDERGVLDRAWQDLRRRQ